MSPNELESLAIALYVPDATVQAVNEGGALRGLILDGVPELDFLPPPWWEGSHTFRLGPVETVGIGARQ
jgi:hypothetical protein